METDWIEIARTGTWTARNGAQVELTTERFDSIVDAYNPTDREAPLVFGHPEVDHPAYGWATRLKRAGEVLMAKFKQIPEAVKQAVAEGHYKKVSMALMPDGKTLRHVGLLGAAQPAVSGLKDVKFSADEDAVCIEFSTESATAGNHITKEAPMGELDDLKKQLEEEKKGREAAEKTAADEKKRADDAATALSAAEKKETETGIGTRLDGLVKKNRILPADKDALSRVALALGKDGEEIELSEGSGKKNIVEHFFDFLGNLPDRKMMTEFSAPADGDGGEDPAPVDLTTRV